MGARHDDSTNNQGHLFPPSPHKQNDPTLFGQKSPGLTIHACMKMFFGGAVTKTQQEIRPHASNTMEEEEGRLWEGWPTKGPRDTPRQQPHTE